MVPPTPAPRAPPRRVHFPDELNTPTTPQLPHLTRPSSTQQPVLPLTPHEDEDLPDLTIDSDDEEDNDLNRTRSPKPASTGRPHRQQDVTTTVPPSKKDKLDRSFEVPPAKHHKPPSRDSPSQGRPGSSNDGNIPQAPILPLATDDQPQAPPQSSTPATPQPQAPQPEQPPTNIELDETLPYNDQDLDETLPYDDQEDPKEQRFAQQGTTQRGFFQEWKDHEDDMDSMFTELASEFPALFGNDVHMDYLIDINSGEVFKVDDTTALLTDDDLRRYPKLVDEADRKELKAFVSHKVFVAKYKRDLPRDANCVDCVWVRKWAKLHVQVKSRMCARGCFDKQKYTIDRHSSTATRLSQRMVVSLGMCHGILYSETGDGTDISTESFDISTAFLQGLDYQELQRNARQLGYEHRHKRDVYIIPPENVWRHFRAIIESPKDLKVPDHLRHLFALLCLRAMYGFADAPLMFQLALVSFLKETTGARSSVFDDNFLFWFIPVKGRQCLFLVMTVHVDDLQLTGCRAARQWIHGHLERRFGTLKRQQLPYTHAGIQLEQINKSCLRLHQDSFTEKLLTHELPKDRLQDPASPCTPEETTIFRSLTCSAFWACQTRLDEVFHVISLQTKLKTPTIADIISINGVTKRLKRNNNKFGIYFWKLYPPYRVICVSDASSPNKSTNFATEGIIVALAEDKLTTATCDHHDYLEPRLRPLVGGKFHILTGTAHKSKRISHSTSHAETLSAAKGIPLAQLVALRFAESELVASLNIRAPLKLLEVQDSGLCPIPVDAYIDCMDLWELCCGIRGTPQDKSQRLGILAIREERRSLRLRRLFHIRTKYMVADMLTKIAGADSKSLLQLITSGHWTIESDIRVRQGFGSSTTPRTTYHVHTWLQHPQPELLQALLRDRRHHDQ